MKYFPLHPLVADELMILDRAEPHTVWLEVISLERDGCNLKKRPKLLTQWDSMDHSGP